MPRVIKAVQPTPGGAGQESRYGGGDGKPAAARDYRYAPGSLADALATIQRIIAILALCSDAGEGGGGATGSVRRSRLPPAYRDALHGELRLLRAQSYKSGLFAEIANVDLLTDAVETAGRGAAPRPKADAGARSAATSGSGGASRPRGARSTEPSG